MQTNLWPAVLASSAPLAAILLLIGLSWVVIFRTTKIFNFAVGEYAILGAYLFYVFDQGLKLGYWPALLLALLAGAALGALTYIGLLRPLAGRPLWAPVVLTMGISFVIDAVLSIYWGSQTLFLNPPVKAHTYDLGRSARMSTNDLFSIIAAVVMFGLLLAFVRFSKLGVRMRSAAELPLLASQSGINITRVFALGWALSAVVATLGGIAYSTSTVLEPSNVSIGILGLTPAILGGLDSIEGVVVGSVITALLANFATLYLGDTALNAMTAIVLLLIIVVRPYGLFGTRAIERV